MSIACPPGRIDPARLRAHREARGLTIERLAVAAGVASRTVSRAELGEAQPRPAIVAVLAATLGVEVESLICDDPALTGEAAKDRGDRPDAYAR
jgi:transcriptional regulator with XRE-family HTH domain